LEQRSEAESARAAQFEKTQKPLWAASSATLTPSALANEIAKCKEDIERNGSPYAWVYDHVRPQASIAAIRSGEPVVLSVEHKLDGPGTNNVELSQYRCSFKGAGYEHFDKSGTSHYTSDYLPQDVAPGDE
jgi:hypothetical protein